MSGQIPLGGPNEWGNWNLQFGLPFKLIHYDVHKVGQISKLLSLPCTPLPGMWFETFFATVPKAIVADTLPTAKEFYHWAHGPNENQKHGRSLLKGIKAIVYGDELRDPDAWDGTSRGVFYFADKADQLSWYAWIIEVFSDAVYEWASAAYQNAACTERPQGQYCSGKVQGPVLTLSPGERVSLGLDGHCYGGSPTGGLSVFVPPGGAFYGAVSVQLEPYIASHIDYWWVECVNLTSGQMLDQGKQINYSDGNTSSSISMVNFPNGTTAEQEIAFFVMVGPMTTGDQTLVSSNAQFGF